MHVNRYLKEGWKWKEFVTGIEKIEKNLAIDKQTQGRGKAF
jgi:hypothetical protein